MRLVIPRSNRTPRRKIGMAKPAPNLLIRLIEDVGKLPAGFTYSLPMYEAQRLIARRKAVPVGAYKTVEPDVVLTQEDWEAAAA
jgi:hypothetical protein